MTEEDQNQLVSQLREKAKEMRIRFNEAGNDHDAELFEVREYVYDDIANIIETLRNP